MKDYYCEKCQKNHKKGSKIFDQHLEFGANIEEPDFPQEVEIDEYPDYESVVEEEQLGEMEPQQPEADVLAVMYVSVVNVAGTMQMIPHCTGRMNVGMVSAMLDALTKYVNDMEVAIDGNPRHGE